MIFVDELPFPTTSSDSLPEGKDTLLSLLEHPSLVSASERLKGMAENRVRLVSEGTVAEVAPPPAKHVYVFQREFATVDPGLVQLAGTDEATTCVGIVIRSQDSGMTSIAHVDSPRVVDSGLSQMLSSFARGETDALVVDTSTGLVMPASFDRSSRCPDEIVRRVRVTVSSQDPNWKGKLLDTYETHLDRFQIAPCSWAFDWGYFAFTMQQLSDSEILFECSTSPLAENPDFVENERRVFDYLINYPDWRQTFSKRRPRIFERAPDGGWVGLK